MGFLGFTGKLVLIIALVLSAHTNAHAHIDSSESIDAYSKMLLVQPQDTELLIKRQFLLRDAGRFQSALLDLGHIQKVEPKHPLVYLELGLTYLKMDNCDLAINHLNTYLLQAAIQSSKQARAIGYRARAQCHQLKKAYSQALEDYDASLKIWMLQDTVFSYGRILEKLRQYEKAEALYRRALEQKQDSASMRISLVRSLRTQEKFLDAIDVLNPLIDQARMPAKWLLLRAELLAAEGKEKAAMKDRNNAMEAINKMLRKRDTGQIRLMRARAWMALGKYVEAREDLFLALDRSPKLLEARRLLDSINLKMPTGANH
jgi:tetratricopeptide (TPR) repeat protein